MFYINKIKTLIPIYFRYKKNYWMAKQENVSLPSGKRIFIFLAANYGNLGDIAITYAQHIILEQLYEGYTIVEVAADSSYSYLKGIVSQITPYDIVTFVGGGNMGDMYPLYENMRQIIVSELPKNKILQFPLTADFSKSTDGVQMLKFAKRIYSKHDGMTILSREKKSSVFLSELLGKHIPVVPDVVLTLNYFNILDHRNGITVCLRNDKEKSLSHNDVSKLKEIVGLYDANFSDIDTVLDDNLITLDNKVSYLEEFLNEVSCKRLMITDRLHGMIFAYITGTPAIVFSNSNHKVRECYEWIKDSGYIFYMDCYDENQFKKNIALAFNAAPDKNQFENRRKDFINQITKAL